MSQISTSTYKYLGPDYGELELMGDRSGRRGSDGYVLLPHLSLRNLKQQKLISISFIYKDGKTIEPILHN